MLIYLKNFAIHIHFGQIHYFVFGTFYSTKYFTVCYRMFVTLSYLMSNNHTVEGVEEGKCQRRSRKENNKSFEAYA